MKNFLVWALIALGMMMLFNQFGEKRESTQALEYSQFISDVKNGQVAQVSIDGREIKGQFASGARFTTYNPGDIGLIGDLLNNNVKINSTPPQKDSVLMQIFISWFPMLLLIAVWIFFARSMGGGMGGKGGPLSFGKSKAKMLSEDQVKVTFDDVAGVEESKQEVTELVDFLRDPTKYQKLGGKIPRGVLMVGPPGTGKTLLAKAIAGEAKVPFFSISGSDFVEMFVGVGASRVRDMFEQAKAHAPCIIFIDEIDAVGRSRGVGLGGGNDEREQTLNQMLVEMDGFEGNEGIIVIAATNRPDVLDPALLRPGRFDRQVTIPLPDVRGREQILKVHLKKVPIDDTVKPSLIARGTPGFSGADMANLVNEAALMAARGDKKVVSQVEFEKAKDKIIMGVERRTMAMSDKEKTLTAYHEAGHAVIGFLMPEHDPVYKVSIIPRGRALGVTMYLPEDDRYSYSKQRLESMLYSLYGGRLAEELTFGPEAVTTGASNDIQRATEIARNMITKWGYSAQLGPLLYAEEENAGFLGGQQGKTRTASEETMKIIDAEVRQIIDRCYSGAKQILIDNKDKLEAMAHALLKYETIDDQQVKNIMEGREPGDPQGWDESETPPSACEPSAAESDEVKASVSQQDASSASPGSDQAGVRKYQPKPGDGWS
jgi:cell division protease FtsH